MRTLEVAMIARKALVACFFVGLLCGQTARPIRAGDITPQQIEQLKKARQDARDTRDSLEKSLKQAEECARKLFKRKSPK